MSTTIASSSFERQNCDYDASSARPVSSLVILLAVLGILVTGCADTGAETPRSPVAGSFVGTVRGAGAEGITAIALVIADSEPSKRQREARVYVSDSRTLNEYFRGSVAGETLEFNSKSGSRLKGAITSDAASGVFTAADGRSFSFDAGRASGIAGLFHVSISTDGQVRGTSETGGRLEGRRARQPEANGRYGLEGIMIPPDGRGRKFRASLVAPEGGNFRWIVLLDGTIRGARVYRTSPDPFGLSLGPGESEKPSAQIAQ